MQSELSRKVQLRKGSTLPDSLLSDLHRLICTTYALSPSAVKIYSFIYPDEFLLILSLKKDDQSMLTIHLSKDLTGDYKNIWEDMIDRLALLIDQFKESTEYITAWQEEDTFFYKITREDIELSMKADRLLGL